MLEYLSVPKLSQSFHQSYHAVLLPAELFKNLQVNLPYYWVSHVWMDSDQQDYILLSSLEKKMPVSILAAKCSPQILNYQQRYRDKGYLISFFYHLSRLSSQELELVCLTLLI